MPGLEPTVVVIEDEAAVLRVLTTFLRSAGFRTRGFISAEEFLGSLDWAPSIDCIVSDLKLPGADGLTLIESSKVRGCTAPIIIMTGHGDVSIAVRAMKAGASDFIEKPFQPNQLEEAVRSALRRARSIVSKADEISSAKERLSRLSDRQLEIVGYIVAGFTSKEIGLRLKTSHRTVEAHRASIFDKLEICSLAELVRISVLVDLA